MGRNTRTITRLGRILAMAMLVLAVALPHAARAQPACEQWREGGSVPGVSGPVNAMTTWDPDGPGPRPALLVVGGQFTAAGNVVANRVAAWDGKGWQSLGTGAANGVNNTVSALAVYNGRLIAGGTFMQAGGQVANNIAAWDGTSWQPLGTGAANGVGEGGGVEALAVYDGRLIAGGLFTQAGGQLANYIAAWDDTSWQPLESGAVNGMSGWVFELTVYNGRLIAGGTFTGAGDQWANRIAAWDGTAWQSLGTGAANGVSNTVAALTVYNGRLIAGGLFTQAGGQAANFIASWDGTSWQSLGTGTANGVNNMVAALTLYNGRLIAGRNFTQAGGQTANSIAAWDGTSWQPLGTGSANGVDGGDPTSRFVHSLSVFNGRLIAGGSFTQAGGQIANRIAAWDDTSWQPLVTGAADGVNGRVLAFTVYNGRLIAGGDFTQAGGLTANRIAAWDGTSWQPLGAGVANGVNGTVSALTVYNGRLIAGGNFTQAGGQPANRIAAWDGTVWQRLDTDAENGLGLSSLGVAALTLYSGRLIAGGGFNQAGGQAAGGIAAWDGTSWQPVGTGTGEVRALTVYNGRLIAGGQLAWDGISWQTLGTGLNSSANALTVYNGRLIAVGLFSLAGGQPANNIAAWDGTSWSSLGTGLAFTANALSSFDPDGVGPKLPVLVAGGSFGTAGGKVSPFFAVWGSPTDSVWSAPTGGNAALSVNWACSAPPDAQQTILFDRVAAGINLQPTYTVSTTAPITAKRLLANTDQVTLNLSGQPITLTGGPSVSVPPVAVGDRVGGFDARLLLRNTAGNSPATFTASGLVIGNAIDPLNNAVFSSRDAALTTRIAGSIEVGGRSRATLEVRDNSTLRYGLDAQSYLGSGFFGAGAGTTPNGTISVSSGGRLESATPIGVLSLGSAVGARSTTTITGTNSRWNAQQADLFIGDLGSASLTISAGGQLLTSTSNSVILGRQPTSSATVTINSGGSWTETLQAINIGGAGDTSQAAITVRSGGTLAASAINIFQGGSLSGTGTVQA
ncbi:MAG: beta strand repeat-containing protein, partial [Phycisphaerales bacterium]